MARRALILSGLCVILGAPLAGQTTPQPGSAARPDHTLPQPLRLTGCVTAWDASTMGPPPPAARGTTEPVPAGPVAPFVLTDAKPVSSTTPSPTGTSGPPPAAEGRPSHSGHATYLLKPATAAVNLAAHVDRQVEITGTLVADESAATPAVAAAAPPRAGAPQPGEDARPPAPPVALTVTAIEVVGKACTSK